MPDELKQSLVELLGSSGRAIRWKLSAPDPHAEVAPLERKNDVRPVVGSRPAFPIARHPCFGPVLKQGIIRRKAQA